MTKKDCMRKTYIKVRKAYIDMRKTYIRVRKTYIDLRKSGSKAIKNSDFWRFFSPTILLQLFIYKSLQL